MPRSRLFGFRVDNFDTLAIAKTVLSPHDDSVSFGEAVEHLVK